MRRTVARISLSGLDFGSTLRAPQRTASPHRARSTDAVTTTTLMPALASGRDELLAVAELPEIEVQRAPPGGGAAAPWRSGRPATGRFSGTATRRTS